MARADGLWFKVPVRIINAGPNARYFHYGECATYFNFTSDQFSGLHYLVIPGTLKEGPYLLAGRLLAAQGDLRGALQVLLDSVNMASDHGNLVQHCRSLYTLMQVAFAAGEQQVFEHAAGERRAVMEQIGPEVRGLAWCGDLP